MQSVRHVDVYFPSSSLNCSRICGRARMSVGNGSQKVLMRLLGNSCPCLKEDTLPLEFI